MNAAPLLELRKVAKSFPGADGKPRTVLEEIDFTLHEHEVVALLGRSGCGKSTLLRIMAGLLAPDGGRVQFGGKPLTGPARGIAMVFQSFALFPWLTAQQNVELGLEAQGIAAADREKRARAMLDLMGLSGFGGALPRELSGGMRQRVGLARALVLNPDILLMDEAFSALDVMTGEALRDHIRNLWSSGQMPTRGIVMVSHSIEEAVLMADRIVILSSNPGRVRAEVPITLPHPRIADAAEVAALVDQVYSLITERRATTHAGAPLQHVDYRLPPAGISRLEGVLDLLSEAPFDGHADLPALLAATGLNDTVLMPACEALHLLGLAHLEQGDITLTPLGRRYAEADQALRQEIFGQQVLTHVPLVSRIRDALEQEPTGSLPQEPFIVMMEPGMGPRDAERVLHQAIEWARYGEAFEYDFRTGRLKLPDQQEE